MSALHNADIAHRLDDFLERRRAPQTFSDNPKLRADQTEAYLTIIRRYAPRGDRLDDWWREFLTRLGEQSETWSWPTEKEVVRAAKDAGARQVNGADRWQPDSVEINLRRLNEGQAIGEAWLWGRGALRLEAAGASPVVLRQRRVQLAEDMAHIYAEDVVRARLKELKARHEEARANVESMQRGHHEANIPNKRAAFLATVGDLVA